MIEPLPTSAAPRPEGEWRTRPEDWFNQVCAALGLFDGARPVSPQRVLWDEVLPMIEALKTNNPEAGVLVQELERVQRLWRDALARMAEANRRADGFLDRWHEVEADRTALRAQLAAVCAARDTLQQQLNELAGRDAISSAGVPDASDATKTEDVWTSDASDRLVGTSPTDSRPATQAERDLAGLRSRGQALVQQWRERAQFQRENFSKWGDGKDFERCADQLVAVLTRCLWTS